MDVIATRDHRMLIARIDQRTANGLREETPVDYETVGELLRLKYAAAAGSTVTSLAHNSSRHVVSTGINRQPAVKVVIPGLERVCDWWWQEDQQLGFLQFLGLWLSDGYLSTRHGVVCIGQQTVESEWLSELLDGVFPRCCNHNEQLKGSDDGIYTIRCPPLYDYLRMMAVGPIGYNPRNPAELRSYPHFTKNEELATLEQQSDYHKPDDSIHSASTWTEDAMLAAFTGSRSPPSTTRSLRSVSSMDEAGGEQDALEMEASPGAALDVVDAAQVQAMQAAGEIVWENDGEGIILDGHWFCRKRWLGEQNVANVFSQLSRQQAIALLDGACRAEGSSSVQYDDSGEPTGAWQCGHSSFPLIDHLQLMGQLTGAAVDVRLHTKAGETSAIDGRAVTLTVDHWQVSFTFTKSQSGLPMQTAPLAQPVDVSNDIDARGYYQHEDDGRVYCITVESDRKGTTANFLTQRLCSGLTQGGSFGVQAHSVFVGSQSIALSTLSPHPLCPRCSFLSLTLVSLSFSPLSPRLPRHSEERVVPRADAAHRAALPAGAAVLPQPRRPPGRSGGRSVQEEPQGLRAHGCVLDGHLRHARGEAGRRRDGAAAERDGLPTRQVPARAAAVQVR